MAEFLHRASLAPKKTPCKNSAQLHRKNAIFKTCQKCDFRAFRYLSRILVKIENFKILKFFVSISTFYALNRVYWPILTYLCGYGSISQQLEIWLTRWIQTQKPNFRMNIGKVKSGFVGSGPRNPPKWLFRKKTYTPTKSGQNRPLNSISGVKNRNSNKKYEYFEIFDFRHFWWIFEKVRKSWFLGCQFSSF